jgi:hypothetical protein
MKKWFPWVIGVVAVCSIGYAIWNQNRPVYFGPNMKYEEKPIEPNIWQPYKAISPQDSTHVYRVTWAESWSASKIAYCKAAFRNDKEKQYKLVAPWATIDIERANMYDIMFEIVSIDSVPKEILQKK